MWIIFFLLYSIIATLFISFLYYKKKDDNNNHLQLLQNELLENSDIQKKIELLAKIQDIKNGLHPWYEKLISTLGVLAFITMSITTLIQTYESAQNETKLLNIKSEIEKHTKEKIDFNRYVKIMSVFIIEKNRNSLYMSDREKNILQMRLKTIQSKPVKSQKNINESFVLAVLTRNYGEVQKIYEEYDTEIEDGDVYTRIHLAEYFFIKNNMILTKRILKGIQETQTPANNSLRYFTLLWEISNKDDQYVTKLSQKQGVSFKKAMARIKEYSNHLKIEKQKY